MVIGGVSLSSPLPENSPNWHRTRTPESCFTFGNSTFAREQLGICFLSFCKMMAYGLQESLFDQDWVEVRLGTLQRKASGTKAVS